MYGPAGIDFYTRTKVVTSRWPDPSTSAVDLGFPGRGSATAMRSQAQIRRPGVFTCAHVFEGRRS